MRKSYIGILFLLLMVFGLYFSTIASNGFCLGDYILNQLGLKAFQNDEEKLGLRYTFFYALFFVIVGWKGAKKYLKDSHPILIKRLPWIFFGMLLFVVPTTTEFAKNTYYSLQDGVKSIEYDSTNSRCQVDIEGEKQLVSGAIVLSNHGNKEVNLSIKLIDREDFVEDIIIRDNQNQTVFKLPPKEKSSLKYEFYIDREKTTFQSGNMNGPKIELVEQNEGGRN
ncbi:hypothetical protein [Desulforamulus aquiferis]|uniref:Uncharacterized protein n=1 Tax=Desulforamulus aquiferis TaxID=1397668 RepID=A0AAW7Z9E9_9FIRM|nr:hypothetical protein [Desulforamulus aquiferis]MDO7786063.1 hypothetical protein [Desulforamulus aquiferis]